MRRSPRSPITAVLLLLSCAAPAAAEPLPRRRPSTGPEQEMLDEAKRLVDQGRIADARDIHLTLWRLTRSASDAFRVGMLSFRLRDFQMAAEFLAIYFDMVGTPEAPKIWVPPGFKEGYELARANFAEARRHVGAIEVRVSEPGAAVLVDGRQVEVPAAVDAGGERTVWLVLRRADAEEPARPSASTTSKAAASPTSKAGAALGAAPPGPARDPALRWWTVGGLAATSVALAVVGGVSVAEANGAAGDRDAAFVRARWEAFRCRPGLPACDAYAEADGRARTFTALSVGAFIGAGLAAGGAVAAGFLLAPEATVRVGAVGGAPGAALSFGW